MDGLYIFGSTIFIKQDPCNGHYISTHSYKSRHKHDFKFLYRKLELCIKKTMQRIIYLKSRKQ